MVVNWTIYLANPRSIVAAVANMQIFGQCWLQEIWSYCMSWANTQKCGFRIFNPKVRVGPLCQYLRWGSRRANIGTGNTNAVKGIRTLFLQ